MYHYYHTTNTKNHIKWEIWDRIQTTSKVQRNILCVRKTLPMLNTRNMHYWGGKTNKLLCFLSSRCFQNSFRSTRITAKTFQKDKDCRTRIKYPAKSCTKFHFLTDRIRVRGLESLVKSEYISVLNIRLSNFPCT